MRAIDELRGLYIRCPYPLKTIAAPFLSLLPVQAKFGPTYRRLAKDIIRSETDADFVGQYRYSHLNQIISSCWNRSPYYAQLFRNTFGRNFSPEDLSVDNLEKLPTLSKETVRSNPEMFLTEEVSNVDLGTTSGSTGVPLKFYLDKNRSVKEWAFAHHLWARIGYQPGTRIAVLRGVQIRNVDKQPWEFDRALSELRLSPFHLVPEIMDKYFQLIEQYKVRFIWGYPSAIFILAKYAVRIGWRAPSRLTGIIPISETLFPHQRDVIGSAFRNCRVSTCYGLSEKVAIAGELPGLQDVYEFEPLYGIAELVDDHDLPIREPGRSGRIVGTGFISTAMPLLRYDTGDIGELVRPATSENSYRLRLRGIRSRWGQEFVVGDNGALISIAAINIHSPIYSKIQNFQLFQDTRGEVKIRVVPCSGYQKEDLLPFVQQIQNKVGNSVKFSLEIMKSLPRNERGKQRFIDQRIDLSNLS